MFFASTMLMVSIALVMAVIVTNIYAKKNTSLRCPDWAVRLASRLYPSYGLPERESIASLVSVASGKDPTEPPPAPRQTPPSRPRRPCDWPTDGKAAAAGRRGTSPGGSGVTRRGPETGAGGGGAAERRARRMQRTAASNSTDSAAMYPRQNSEEGSVVSGGGLQERGGQERARLKAEWRLVALMADRVFLWAFAALSVATHATLLVQMIFQHSFGD